MGHEYCGIVEEVGRDVKSIKPGEFVVGSLPLPTILVLTAIRLPVVVRASRMDVARSIAILRVPLAEGTLVSTPACHPMISCEPVGDFRRIRHRLVRSRCGQCETRGNRRGRCDGAVGLLGVLSARQMGAERIIAMSRHEARQKLAREFGATDIVTERGEKGAKHIIDMTSGIGADSVLECVGTQESMIQAIRCTREAVTSHTLAFRMALSLKARSFSTHTSISTAAPPLFAVTCPS